MTAKGLFQQIPVDRLHPNRTPKRFSEDGFRGLVEEILQLERMSPSAPLHGPAKVPWDRRERHHTSDHIRPSHEISFGWQGCGCRAFDLPRITGRQT